MNYRIIQNHERLKSFIARLPELEVNEKWFVTLLARRKYVPDVTIDLPSELALKKFLSKTEHLYNKIRQLEVSFGSFETDEGDPVPQQALALYMSANPRNLRKGAKNATKIFIDKLDEGFDGIDPDSILLSEIQKVGRKVFVDFDIDNTKEFDFYRLSEIVNTDACRILKTHGGYHVLVDTKRISDKYKKTWYQNMENFPGIDKNQKDRANTLIPVPGTTQGNFEPQIIF